MIVPNNYKLLFPVALTLALTACANTPAEPVDNSTYVESAPYEVAEDYTTGVISYTVQNGDGLGRIAEEFTGSIDNWREIANYNNITNPRRLRVGTVLDIPTHLIPGYQRSTPTIQSAPINNPPVAQNTTLAVRLQEGPDVAPVVVSPVNTNRDFSLNAVDPNAPQAPRSYAGSGAQIKVIGTYYPKGIYTEPAAYSKLIMRVAPGTVFSLDSLVNDWYRINTDSGTGYIRASDAVVVE